MKFLVLEKSIFPYLIDKVTAFIKVKFEHRAHKDPTWSYPF